MNTVRKKQQVAGSTLKHKRRSLGLSALETAKLLCVPESTYHIWENSNGSIEAIPFASGDWDKTIHNLAGVKAVEFLECIGKLHAALNDENQAQAIAAMDNVSSVMLAKIFSILKR